MSDIWLKLRMLRLYWPIPRAWWRDVWLTDPDAAICCGGWMCGCYGARYYEMWESMLRRAPPWFLFRPHA